ncbi:hypothetical protein AgCh_011806 [Apium graveolens]
MIALRIKLNVFVVNAFLNFSLVPGSEVHSRLASYLPKDGKGVMDNGKYVRYTPEQVEALEHLYHECPKPRSVRRQQLIRECPILSKIEPKQIKFRFRNMRCREKPFSRR